MTTGAYDESSPPNRARTKGETKPAAGHFCATRHTLMARGALTKFPSERATSGVLKVF